MTKKVWRVVCDGGPNDHLVGFDEKALGPAFGRGESMMKALCANNLWIHRIGSGSKEPRPVDSEEEAGSSEDAEQTEPYLEAIE